ncbi:hypothetical protein [Shouchella lonarensis]|uniref:Uncharacterized protein n=1 Tax=Shouchella lonarensis TaxID=1464122 RepID=A0A1G6IVP2_9BACI|nr:hypothetical protein [Shouchella lonarensis]SDC10577.1 hypothetical protein SAMN05421737_105180 [Shouchella lonarensis]
MNKTMVSTFAAVIVGAVSLTTFGEDPATAATQNFSQSQTNAQVLKQENIVITSNFSDGTDDWAGGFAEYFVGEEHLSELLFDHRTLPKQLDDEKKALFLSGQNDHGDLFMFVKKKLSQNLHLKPNTAYDIQFDFDIVSDLTTGQPDLSAGEDVYVKAGASPYEPMAYIGEHGNYWRMSADKGHGALSGQDALTVGNLAKNTSVAEYEKKHFHTAPHSFVAETNDNGELWLFVGTDSSFTGKTSIYIPRIEATLTEVTM